MVLLTVVFISQSACVTQFLPAQIPRQITLRQVITGQNLEEEQQDFFRIDEGRTAVGGPGRGTGSFLQSFPIPLLTLVVPMVAMAIMTMMSRTPTNVQVTVPDILPSRTPTYVQVIVPGIVPTTQTAALPIPCVPTNCPEGYMLLFDQTASPNCYFHSEQNIEATWANALSVCTMTPGASLWRPNTEAEADAVFEQFQCWNCKFSYSLVIALMLFKYCENSKVNETKDWKECPFASFCLCKNAPGSFLLIADCSDKNLLQIPRLPNILQDLSFQNNNTSRIEDGIFEKHFLLKSLDLSSNRIRHIGKFSFEGLKNLLSLNLRNNDLEYGNNSFESSAFFFLESLKILNIQKNFNTSFMPDLSDISSLELLSMDYVSDTDAVLSKNIKYLKNLKSINLSGFTGYCKMHSLSSKTFFYLPQITHVTISKCKIQFIYKGTFENMRNISELDVSYNTCLGFAALENITTDVQQSAIKILKVNYIHGIFEMSTVLKTSHIWNLNRTSLIRFEAAGNRIQRIESGALRNFPVSLESVDIRDNVFSIGIYMFDAVQMPITSLDVSQTFSSHNVLTSYIERCVDTKHTVSTNLENNWLFDIVSFYRKVKGKSVFRVPVPTKLRIVTLRSSAVKYEIPEFMFTTNELNNLTMSDNAFHTWTGPITNVKSLSYLDLSSNFCSNVSKDFFSKDFINLRYLLLEDNLLGLVIPTDFHGEILENLGNVGLINLSANKITNIPKLFFKNQYNLETLDLSDNMIDDINFKVSHMKKLTFLNLRNNRISALSEYAMQNVNLMANRNTNLTIDLSGNNLVCNCDTLTFVEWIVNTHIYLQHRNQYRCKMTNNTIILLRNPRNVHQTLKKDCMSYEGFIIGITSGILIFIFTLCGGIVYRYRWKLRYLYYMVKVKWHDHEYQSDNTEERLYMYDAFVSYADEDQTFVHNLLVRELETENAIQLCLHKRNFLPGNDIATNITSAIHNSRKTIVIMSHNYVGSYWCMFEYNMARMESIYERKCENILFLVFYEQMSASDLPLQVLELVHDQSYIEYPNDEHGDIVFWEQLRKAID
ncbi:toll-like receptor 4 [Mytilus edulis]|uniref:toll-like receptor 4 n=1 Tax=Mytilus edulis TaxID=6550 RepID=UPI0039F13DC4